MTDATSKGLARYLPEFIVTVASAIVVYSVIDIKDSVAQNSIDIVELKTTVQNLSTNITTGMVDRFSGADGEVMRRRIERLEDRANGVVGP